MTLIRNWADTEEPGADPGPLVLSLAPAEALARAEAAVRSLPRWRVVSADAAAGLLTATRTTRVFRFVDDVTLRFQEVDGGSRVHARSKSRVGLSDLGQNRRNLHELFAALARGG